MRDRAGSGHRNLAFGVLISVYGFAGLGAQMVLLRELAVLFYGNELFLGFSLAAWLAWGGLGTAAGRRFRAGRLPWYLAALGGILLASVLLLRALKPRLGFGLIPGPLAMAGATAAILGPAAFVSGIIFRAACNFSKVQGLLGVPKIYFYETAGAALFGIGYALIFAGEVSIFELASLLTAALMIAVFYFVCIFENRKILGGALLAASLILFACAPALDRWSRRFEWRGYTLLESRDSRYGHLAVTRTGELKQFFQDGILSANFPDPRGHEELVHWALLASGSPWKVLLLGGGPAGEIAEILKYPVENLDYVEIDPAAVQVLERHLDEMNQEALRDPRVRIFHEDGRAWLRDRRGTYEVLLFHLPEPANAQINRFYTLECFQDAAKRLAPGGLLALRIPSSENYLPEPVAFLNRSVLQTLRTVFPYVKVIPGQELILLASRDPIETDPEVLGARYRELGLRNLLAEPGYFRMRQDPARTAFVERELSQASGARLNSDRRPVSHFYAWKLWALKHKGPRDFLFLAGGVLLLILGAQALIEKMSASEGGVDRSTAAMFLLGFTGMIYETALLLGYQARVGYVFQQIGSLFALFMLGMAAGSWTGSQVPAESSSVWRRSLLLGQIFYGILLYGALGSLDAPVLWMKGLYSLLMVPGGFLLGIAFAVFSQSSPPERVYAADLWGSAAGALLTSLVLVPLLGLAPLCALTAALVLFFALVEYAFPSN